MGFFSILHAHEGGLTQKCLPYFLGVFIMLIIDKTHTLHHELCCWFWTRVSNPSFNDIKCQKLPFYQKGIAINWPFICYEISGPSCIISCYLLCGRSAASLWLSLILIREKVFNLSLSPGSFWSCHASYNRKSSFIKYH